MPTESHDNSPQRDASSQKGFDLSGIKITAANYLEPLLASFEKAVQSMLRSGIVRRTRFTAEDLVGRKNTVVFLALLQQENFMSVVNTSIEQNGGGFFLRFTSNGVEAVPRKEDILALRENVEQLGLTGQRKILAEFFLKYPNRFFAKYVLCGSSGYIKQFRKVFWDNVASIVSLINAPYQKAYGCDFIHRGSLDGINGFYIGERPEGVGKVLLGRKLRKYNDSKVEKLRMFPPSLPKPHEYSDAVKIENFPIEKDTKAGEAIASKLLETPEIAEKKSEPESLLIVDLGSEDLPKSVVKPVASSQLPALKDFLAWERTKETELRRWHEWRTQEPARIKTPTKKEKRATRKSSEHKTPIRAKAETPQELKSSPTSSKSMKTTERLGSTEPQEVSKEWKEFLDLLKFTADDRSFVEGLLVLGGTATEAELSEHTISPPYMAWRMINGTFQIRCKTKDVLVVPPEKPTDRYVLNTDAIEHLGTLQEQRDSQLVKEKAEANNVATSEEEVSSSDITPIDRAQAILEVVTPLVKVEERPLLRFFLRRPRRFFDKNRLANRFNVTTYTIASRIRSINGAVGAKLISENIRGEFGINLKE